MNQDRRRSAFNWLFEDRETGRIVIGQMPNALMWLFLVAFAATYVTLPGWPKATARIVATVALALWGLDETVRGVNPWRRCLGVAVLIGIAVYAWWSR